MYLVGWLGLGLELVSQSKVPRDSTTINTRYIGRVLAAFLFVKKAHRMSHSAANMWVSTKNPRSHSSQLRRERCPSIFFPSIKKQKHTHFFQFFISVQVVPKWQHGDQTPERAAFHCYYWFALTYCLTAWPSPPFQKVKPFDRLLGAFPINNLLLCASSLPNQNHSLLLRASFPQTNNLCAFVSCSQQTIITFCFLLL